MKKLLALILAIFMMFSLVACGGGADDGDKPSSTPVVNNDDIDDGGEEKGELVLDGNDAYVVCVKVGSDLTINSIEDIKGLNVGATHDYDGYKIAEYFEANVVGFGGDNDVLSELNGGSSLDCAIVKKITAEAYQQNGSAKIILDPIVIE